MNERDRIAALVAAPIDLILSDGKEYRWKPLNIQDIEELTRFCRYSELRDVEAETVGFDPAIRQRLCDKAYDRCASLGPAELKIKLESIAGVRKMLWLGLVKFHDVQFEAMSELFPATMLEYVKGQLNRGSGAADPTSSRLPVTTGDRDETTSPGGENA